MQVDVVYALPGEQVVVRLDLAPGSTLRDAIERSGLCRRYPQIDLSRNRVGVFGRLRELDTPVSAGDRVEIYRPLSADPKVVRRQRAAKRERNPIK